MNVRLNDKPLEEVDCFKYIPVVARGSGCERDVVVVQIMNERYKELITESVLNNRG